jgi:hypothetical protein
MKLFKPKNLAVVTSAAAMLAAFNASASFVFDASGTGEDAQATITLNNGSVTVVLTDLEANPTSVGQLISSFQFNVSGATGTGTASGTIGSGNVADVSSGTYTPTAASPLSHWGYHLTSGNILLETAGMYAAGGQPTDLIIGPDSAGSLTGAGEYNMINGSLENSHEPVVLGSATFTIADAGVTAGSSISDVIFGFGTGPDSFLDGTPVPVPVPEASTVVAGLLLLLPLGVSTLRRIRAA